MPTRLRAAAPTLVAALVLVAVMSPMLFTEGTFGKDWLNHLWLVTNQTAAVSHTGLPTYWTHTDRLGVFYPQFVFYGGTLYAATGYLGALLGGASILAYIATFAAGFAMAYGGWTWAARQAGLGGLEAQLPGLIHVTAAYVITNAYARGSWPEFMATSAIPLVAASAWWLLHAPRLRPWPVAAFVVSLVVLTGSHNITLTWGAVFLVGIALAMAAGLGRGVAGLGLRRVGAVAGLAVLAVGVNAWFLLPDLVYARRTGLVAYATGAPMFNDLGLVLNPLRSVPASSSTPGLYVQLPVFALAWALVALALVRGRAGAAPLRVAAALGALLAVFGLLVTRDDPFLERLGAPGVGLWRHMPEFLTYVQFAFRLQSYVVMLVCGLVLVGLVALRRGGSDRTRGGLRAAAGALAVFSVGIAVWQAWNVPSFFQTRSLTDGDPHVLPPSWEDQGNFQDRSARIVPRPRQSAGLTPDQASSTGRSSAPLPVNRRPVVTNVTGGAYLLDLTGVEALGRSRGNQLVVRRSAQGDDRAPLVLAVAAATHGPMAAGRAITGASLLALLLGAAWAAVAARRPVSGLSRRRGGRRARRIRGPTRRPTGG